MNHLHRGAGVNPRKAPSVSERSSWLPEIYRDDTRTRDYWCKDSRGFFMRINIGLVRLRLRSAGFSNKCPKGRFISPLEEAVHKIQMEHRVHVVRSLKEHTGGVHDIDGRKTLILNSYGEGAPK